MQLLGITLPLIPTRTRTSSRLSKVTQTNLKLVLWVCWGHGSRTSIRAGARRLDLVDSWAKTGEWEKVGSVDSVLDGMIFRSRHVVILDDL